MCELLLAYDIGTTGAKAVIFRRDASVLCSSYKQYPTYYPQPGWVEQKPEDWWQAVVAATRDLMDMQEIDPRDIVGISFSGQMMGQVPVDKDGQLLLERVPIWADGRAVNQAEKVLNDLGGYESFYKITLQGHNPQLYSIFRVMWFRENNPDIFKKTRYFLHSKEFIANRLTGRYGTDFTDQALGCTLNVTNRTWSEEIFKAAGLSHNIFPQLMESIDVMGYVTKEAAETLHLIEGIPVVVGAGDAPCAAAGAGAIFPNDAYFYIGSASWGGTIETKPLGDFETKITVGNHLVPGLYHCQYVMYTGGIAQQWAIETFFGSEPTQEDIYLYACNLARTIPRSEDTVLFLPFMRGGGAPYNNMNARGVFSGLGLQHRREHLYRAVLEGVAMNIKILLDRFEKFRDNELSELSIIGGGSRNPFWMELIADITGRRITTSKFKQEANCFAAAQCAGIGVGLYKDFTEVKQMFHNEHLYIPNQCNKEFYNRKFSAFLEAYQGMRETFELLAQLETM